MQVIFDEIVNNIRAIDRESVLSPEVMHQIVSACVHAVGQQKRHDQAVKEEHSVKGLWALHHDRED